MTKRGRRQGGQHEPGDHERAEGHLAVAAECRELGGIGECREREADRFATKYGWQYRIAMVVERVIVAVRRTTGPARRIVRITPAEATPGLPTPAN